MTRLLDRFGLEDAIDCFYCKGLYDLRFWRVLSDTAMRCPGCKAIVSIDEAVDLTEENTRRWAEETESSS